MNAWQPIETAPKDGQTVLCFWSTDGPIDHANYGLAMCDAGRWHHPDDGEEEYRDPSHWMPLPPPPGATA